MGPLWGLRMGGLEGNRQVGIALHHGLCYKLTGGGTLWAVGPGPWLPWEKAPTSPATRAPWTSEPARLLAPPGTGWHLTASAVTPDPSGAGGGRAIAIATSAGCVGTPPPTSPLISAQGERVLGTGLFSGPEWRKSGARTREPCGKHGGWLHPSPADRRPPNSQEGAGLCWVPSNLGGGESSRLIKELCQVGCEESR